MPFDESLANAMRDDLGIGPGMAEKKMFGGLCFLLNGNMVCGVHKGGLMYRVGKTAEADALVFQGVRPLSFTGRRMGGIVEADADLPDSTRAALTTMALAHAASLPAK
ncbi:TfoX/Sxy family protein [Fluviibacterium sp. DFM31]|uniref:TfoX/Sxy family protein n=1 Tax=Meridianimarinicoccus marinus TaxID=3231483 RepID=A0ABV3L4A2_9RHOB